MAIATRPKSAVLPREFKFWPDDKVANSPQEIQALYEAGYAGAFEDKVASENFAEFIARSGGSLDGGAIAATNGLEGSGEGRLVLPYLFCEKLYPGCFPGAAQQIGDCVSHSTMRAAFLTMCCDIISAKPDEVTGLVEIAPAVSAKGIQQGVLSTELIYWWRGYNGDGWSCEAAAQVAIEKAAIALRQAYPELGIDLTVYSGKLAHKYGAEAPPDDILEFGKQHLVRTATRLRGFEQLRDYLANGYGVTTCGGEGWSNQRDENGYSSRRGSWAHAFGAIGADDRDVIKKKYGEPLVLCLNNWAKWNTGGRRILGTDIDIPEGAWWAKWSDFSRRLMIAFSGANGFPAKELPPFDFIVG